MTERAPPRLVFFPGLGADERLFGPQRCLRASLEVVKWIEPHPRESFAEYGRRIADTICSPRPFYLVGVSLGGMIALEVARHVDPLAVILISSCRSCAELPWWSRAGRFIARAVPASLQKWVNVRTPAAAWALGACTPAQGMLARDMIRDTPATFLKWGLLEALCWPGPGELRMPVYRVHGARDRTIPCPGTSVDHVIAGGGHLINLTHSDRVNAFIESITRR